MKRILRWTWLFVKPAVPAFCCAVSVSAFLVADYAACRFLWIRIARDNMHPFVVAGVFIGIWGSIGVAAGVSKLCKTIPSHAKAVSSQVYAEFSNQKRHEAVSERDVLLRMVQDERATSICEQGAARLKSAGGE